MAVELENDDGGASNGRSDSVNVVPVETRVDDPKVPVFQVEPKPATTKIEPAGE